MKVEAGGERRFSSMFSVIFSCSTVKSIFELEYGVWYLSQGPLPLVFLGVDRGGDSYACSVCGKFLLI